MIIKLEKYVKTSLFYEQLSAAYPQWVNGGNFLFAISTTVDENELFTQELILPDDANLGAIEALILAHDANALDSHELAALAQAAANSGFKALPTWAIVTPQAGHDYLVNNVWNGSDITTINAWIDSNVTTLAQARTGLKNLAAAVVSLRDMEANLAMAILYLRNLVIK